ncbi:MAG: complex I subunit 5 family protein [Nitrosomonas sp.]|nr:complex I subunit 5 family protein [Nitrosomonas sp.]
MNSLLLPGILWPLLLVCLMGFRTTRALVLPLTPWAALPALVAASLLTPGETRWHFPGLLLGSEIGLDATGQVFLLLTALLWTVSGVYARSYLRQSNRREEFYFFFLLSMTGNFILIVTQDLFGFYFGFSLMSFAAYGLIIHDRSAAALRAGRVYIILTVIAELMLFAALVVAAGISGATTFEALRAGLAVMDPADRNLVILLGVAGSGIKAGLFGLHVWLPLAHPVAPAPASAVLSGAMIKAGLLGWLQLLPLGLIALPGWGAAMILLGLTAAFYGVTVGLTQRDPKTLLAYSSISQMGVMTMAVGAGLLMPHAWPFILPAIAFYALHHGLSKGALFLGAGLAGGSDRRQQRWIWLGLWLPALALAGAPWTSGMLAKQLVKTHTLYAPAPWDVLLPLLLSVSALATTLLMARLLYLLRPAARSSTAAPVADLIAPWAALLPVIALMPWWFTAAINASEMETESVMDSLWPVLVTAAVTWIVLRLGLFRTLQPVPAGDILTLWTRAFQRFQLPPDPGSFSAGWNTLQARTMTRLTGFIMAVQEKFDQLEDYLSRWDVALLCAIILAAGSTGIGIGFIWINTR